MIHVKRACCSGHYFLNPNFEHGISVRPALNFPICVLFCSCPALSAALPGHALCFFGPCSLRFPYEVCRGYNSRGEDRQGHTVDRDASVCLGQVGRPPRGNSVGYRGRFCETWTRCGQTSAGQKQQSSRTAWAPQPREMVNILVHLGFSNIDWKGWPGIGISGMLCSLVLGGSHETVTVVLFLDSHIPP